LLRFAPGNSQIPVTGFKDLQGNDEIIRFTLKKVGKENDFPKSHTWYKYIYYNINIYNYLFYSYYIKLN